MTLNLVERSPSVLAFKSHTRKNYTFWHTTLLRTFCSMFECLLFDEILYIFSVSMVFVFCLCSLTMFSVQISLFSSILILISWFKNSTNFMRTSKQFINQSFVSTGNLHNYSSTGVYVVLTSRWVYFVSILKKQSSHCVSNWLEVFPQWYLFVVRWFFYQWLLFVFFFICYFISISVFFCFLSFYGTCDLYSLLIHMICNRIKRCAHITY